MPARSRNCNVSSSRFTPCPEAASRRRRAQAARLLLLICAGGIVGLVLLTVARVNTSAPQPEPTPAPAAVRAEAPPEAPAQPDLAALRRQAWAKVNPRLDEADLATRSSIRQSIQVINSFFADRKTQTRQFAEVVLSMRGKWRWVRSRLPCADRDGHRRYLAEQFNKYVFAPDQLKAVATAAVAEYAGSLEGAENQLLVRIRADVDDMPDLKLPALASDELFRREYGRMLDRVADAVTDDVEMNAARELTSLVAGEVAAAVGVRVVSAVATKLGVSAGILGAGAASSWATFGIGLAAAVVIDIGLDQAMRWAGYDPEGEVAAQVDATLDHIRTLMVDGAEPGGDEPELRGLRAELASMNSARAELRREALRRLVLEGEQP